MLESNYDGKVDVISIYSIATRESKFKFGGKFLQKNRSFSERRFDISDNNHSYNGYISAYLNDSNIGMSIPEYPQLYGVYISDATQLSNTYDAYQTLFAAYIMTDQQLTKRFRAVYGIRMETTDIFLQSAEVNNATGQLKGIDILPAINLTYKPHKKINIRAAYTRTLARPSFRELAPYASFEFAGDYTLIGNENLQRTLTDNIDFRLEWALNTGELISFDLFYKGFINPIERTFVATAGNDELTFQNADRADVYGMEFEFRKNLNFIESLKNVKLGFNIALVTSAVIIPNEELDIIHATDPGAQSTRSMYGQAPYIVNSFLNYTSKKLGIDTRLIYSVSGPKLVIIVRGGTPNVYEAPRHSLDYILKKSFGQKIRIFFKAKNLINSDFKQYYKYKKKEYIYSNFKIGRSFSLGFSYKI
jgi:TonB-dependent receptor